MITQKAYELLNKYAKKLAKKPEDADDIFQEAMVLFYQNPSSGILSKRFLYKLVRTGMLRFYYDFNKIDGEGNKFTKRNWETKIDNFNEVALALPEEYDLENIVFLKQLRNKLKLTKKESIILDTLLTGDNPGYEFRTHTSNIREKIKKLM